jgi:hypothetical protein
MYLCHSLIYMWHDWLQWMEDREMPWIHKYGESKMNRIMMAAACQVTSGSELRTFQATWFVLDREYQRKAARSVPTFMGWSIPEAEIHPRL